MIENVEALLGTRKQITQLEIREEVSIEHWENDVNDKNARVLFSIGFVESM